MNPICSSPFVMSHLSSLAMCPLPSLPPSLPFSSLPSTPPAPFVPPYCPTATLSCGVPQVKTRILEYLAVGKLKGDMRGSILCLMGPPGIGKVAQPHPQRHLLTIEEVLSPSPSSPLPTVPPRPSARPRPPCALALPSPPPRTPILHSLPLSSDIAR